MEAYQDYVVRGTAAGAQVRVFAATTRNLVEEARKRHNTSPVATAALGRLLTAGAMMGCMMKGEKDLLTLQIRCSGPIGGLTVTADAMGKVKGYAVHPEVMLPINSKGKLDVGGALGTGILNVMKDMGLKEPYAGQTVLQTGEIAEDLTYYFAHSEQIPSSVGLGVLMHKNNTVAQAGGFILQLMPFAEEKVIGALEKKLSSLTSVTTYLEAGMSPEDLLSEIFGEMELEITDRQETSFFCNCSRERVEKALISMGEKELKEMIAEGREVQLHCHFCNKDYGFSIDDLKRILKGAERA